MKVNHLCFTAKDFLRLVGECRGDEIVFFQTDWGKFWKGYVLAGEYKVIREVKKDREIREIEETFPIKSNDSGDSRGAGNVYTKKGLIHDSFP